MLNKIFFYEVRHWFSSMLTYVFMGAFFLIGLALMLGTSGYFDAKPGLAEEDKVILLNTPYELTFVSHFLIKIVLFIIPVFVGNSLYRDFQSRIYTILYAFPIPKKHYIWAKLLSALTIVLVIGLVVLLGIFLAELIVGNDHAGFGDFNPKAYWIALFVFMVPNLMIVSLLVFVGVGLSRNIYAGFMIVLFVLFFQSIVAHVFFQQEFLFGLLDPLGQHAFQLATKAWTLDMRNSGAIPVDMLVIYNRVFWLGLSGIVFFVFLQVFDFQYNKPIQFKPFLNSKKMDLKPRPSQNERLSAVTFELSWLGRLKTMLLLSQKDFIFIVNNWIFKLIACFGILVIFFIEFKVTNSGELRLLPYTRLLISSPLKIYQLIILITTFLCSGMLFHRAKKSHMNALIDVTPIYNSQLLISKIWAVAGIQLVMLTLFAICSIGIQWYNGFYDLELGLYLFHLLALVFPVLLLWNIASACVHTLIPNLFIGLFALLMLVFSADVLHQAGISTLLLKWNATPALIYSDFQGYGQQLAGYFWAWGYWCSMAIICLLLAYLFWSRGLVGSFRESIHKALSRFELSLKLTLIVVVAITLFFVYKIRWAEHKIELAKTSHSSLQLEVFKNKWSTYSKIPQPKITKVDLKIDLFPQKQAFFAQGHYTLINTSDKMLDTLLLRTGFDEYTQFNWNKKALLLEKDTLMKYYAFVLQKSLKPQDSIRLDFAIESIPNELLQKNSSVLSNGTFLQDDILPRLVYQFEESELSPDDKQAGEYHYFGKDANYVEIKTEISTQSDQIAIAPGKLLSKRMKQGRSFFIYETEFPVKFNFSFHSAAYQKLSEKYLGKTIEIYSLKKHRYNLSSLLKGSKAALDFDTKWLGDYPHSVLRIIETPHTESNFVGTLTANNIPSSENLFIINTTFSQEQINMPFYVIAHELTHEWFGNQLMPANALGAKMLTESITEYLSLLIYEQKFGEEAAQKFLQLQERRYQNGQKNAEKDESPLVFVSSDQEYIAYGKGTMMFYKLSQLIGEEKLLMILRQFLQLHKNKTKQFPTSFDFINYLEEHISLENQNKVNALFLSDESKTTLVEK